MAITPVTTQTLFRQWRLITNEIITVLGDNLSLSTTEKGSLVGALNEIGGELGSLSSLSTTAQDTIVNAINEVLSAVGDIATLTTTDQSSTVNAIIELVTKIGSVSTLATTEKGSLVGAINEIAVLSGDLSLLTTSIKGDVVSSIAVNTGGTGYTSGDVLTISAGNSDATVTVTGETSGVIDTVSVTTGGTGYSNAAGVATTGGTGNGATLDISTGSLTDAINELDSGQGDLSTLNTTAQSSLVAAINEILSNTTASLTLANIQVNNLESNKGRLSSNDESMISVVNDGVVTSIAVDTAGSGFSVAPNVEITGDGTGAMATAVLAATGGVKNVVLTAAGTAYVAGEVITLGGGNSDATITIDSVGGSGEITGYSITAAGTGYANGTDVTVTGGTGTGATFDTTAGFALDSITVDMGGSDYTTAPTVTITGDGDGATATATIASVDTFSLDGTTLQTHNGATLLQGDAFYNDNSSNGGAGNALALPVSQLLTATGRSDLRYGHEFYLLDITASTGTSDGQLINTENYYPVVQNNEIFLSRAGNTVTWSGWVKAQSVNDAPTFTGVVIGDSNVTTYIDGGAAEASPFILTFADGWTHVRQTITLGKEYENIFPAIYANNLDNILVALPVLLDGDINIGMHEGIV